MKRSVNSKVCLVFLVLTGMFCDVAQGDYPVDQARKRILFLGNSYTSPLRQMMTTLLAGSPYAGSTLEFIAPGGCTLKQHLNNSETVSRIQSGDWDYVVLQEQSQIPSLSNLKDAFFDAAEELCEIIEDADSVPVFYMTWGRRDGDQMNRSVNPDYETMQEKLTEAYEKAARKNHALLAPVGEVWSSVREDHEELGLSLYRDDGSHASPEGTYLIASVFYRLLFDDSLGSAGPCRQISESDAQHIRNAVLKTRMSN